MVYGLKASSCNPLIDKIDSNTVCFEPLCLITYTARLLWLACGTLLHSYCTGTYTEVTVLVLWGYFLLPWSTHTVTLLEYLRGYSNVALELL